MPAVHGAFADVQHRRAPTNSAAGSETTALATTGGATDRYEYAAVVINRQPGKYFT